MSIFIISFPTFIAVWTHVALTINIIINPFFKAFSAENLVTVFAHHGILIFFYTSDISFIIRVTKRAYQDISTSSSAIRSRESLAFIINLFPFWIYFGHNGLSVPVFVSVYLFFFLSKELCEDLLLFNKVSLIVF